ncbi:hypothetical protein GALMADRAFT_116481 [Galerina marginata CBS 339.88]|uniref:CFA20 domain-containing protein n=1 Tax=Galerina marginata (strain CBS 339.88) TaxID=685588 RepID=A0A067TJ92_GALM3|nr:hypothetical protein GALMADRAFT_116481 [Galerina marginata CBS 339.88]
MLFSPAVQPSTISLFSSTSSEPLALFSSSTDQALPSDSFVHLLHDRLSSPLPVSPRTLLHLPTVNDAGAEEEDSSHGVELEQTVLHLQSPTIRTTYIQCPPVVPSFDAIGTHDKFVGLGIKHPWLHLQVRNLGREWSFEVGVVDHSGRTGIIRFSTFQKKPRLKMNHVKSGSPPLLLLPLSFPSRSTHPLTPWNTINIHFPSLLPYFSSPALRSLSDGNQEGTLEEPTTWRRGSSSHPSTSNPISIPTGTYSCASYVRVYASCRLRRIWFGESGPSQKATWEFELYSSD